MDEGKRATPWDAQGLTQPWGRRGLEAGLSDDGDAGAARRLALGMGGASGLLLPTPDDARHLLHVRRGVLALPHEEGQSTDTVSNCRGG